MNRLMILVLLLVVQGAAAGCTALGGSRTVVTRRYAAQTEVRDETPTARISVFALPVPAAPATETALTSLGAEAQAELVKVMAARTQSGGAQSLVQALATPIRGASATPSFRDLTRFSRRLVFSLENQSSGAANRISEARIYVRPAAGTRFASWNRIENVYETVDIGKLSLSQERSAGAELGLAIPVLAATPALNASAGSTLQEEIQLRQRRTVLTGVLGPEEAMLLQQGGTGIDLTGNVTADFEFVVPHGGDETVFIPSLPAACEQPSFNRQTIRYPARSSRAVRAAEQDSGGLDTVRVDVELRYTLRDVPRGHSTITESDDHVVFRRGADRLRGVAVLPAEALRFSVFELRMGEKTILIQGATQSGTTERTVPLQFANFEDAAAMLAWMRRCTMGKVGHPLFAGARELAGDDAKQLSVWRRPVNHGGPGEEPRLRPQ